MFIDAYDSFSNNIISLLESALDISVSVIKIDTRIRDFSAFIQNFHAIVLGPGPGDPRKSKDVGHFENVWKLQVSEIRPVLGICLGFQSLVFAHGGIIKRLPKPRHGLVRIVRSSCQSVFQDLPVIETVQYHSLHALVNDPKSENPSQQTESCTDLRSDLRPIAWEVALDNEGNDEDSPKGNPDHILMAVTHRWKPFVGVQFHPESIKSSREAQQIVVNWWNEVCSWWTQNPEISHSLKVPHNVDSVKCESKHSNGSTVTPTISEVQQNGQANGWLHVHDERRPRVPKVIFQERPLGALSVAAICNVLRMCEKQCVVLDSERHQDAEVGRHSIIGVVASRTIRFEYFLDTGSLDKIVDQHRSSVDLSQFDNNPFHFFESFMTLHKVTGGKDNIPFWGGLMGFITYEACLECLAQKAQCSQNPFVDEQKAAKSQPAIGFAFVERSIVIDHFRQGLVVQSIQGDDLSWVEETSSTLSNEVSRPQSGLYQSPSIPPFKARFNLPDENSYKSLIRRCKDVIRTGDSYELCLTNTATVEISRRLSAWSLYLRLRQINPAPFASFIRLGPLSFLSSSPERFMRWLRPVRSRNVECRNSRKATSILQYRPIKGTVARYDKNRTHRRTLSEAKSILSTAKEQAENLMIVDLIRHDLHGVCGSGNVTVPKLMVVEEYETVFQLVSVIEGHMEIDSTHGFHNVVDPPIMNGLKATQPVNSKTVEAAGRSKTHDDQHVQSEQMTKDCFSSKEVRASPFTALPATLPPGSMTGAPKLRSCQILKAFETTPRGAYSGVVGYMDAGGGGDWSVSIRCAARWDLDETYDECDAPEWSENGRPRACRQDEDLKSGHDTEVWTVGAGGAITSLSTEEGEWLEMMAKLRTTLRLFH